MSVGFVNIAPWAVAIAVVAVLWAAGPTGAAVVATGLLLLAPFVIAAAHLLRESGLL